MSSPSVALCAESEVQSPSGDVSGIEIFRFSRLLLSEHNVCDSKGLKMLYVFIIQALNTLKRKSVLVFYSCDCRKWGKLSQGRTWALICLGGLDSPKGRRIESYGAVSAFIYLWMKTGQTAFKALWACRENGDCEGGWCWEMRRCSKAKHRSRVRRFNFLNILNHS